jgi:hypothetical protein
LPDVPTLPG